jgi:glycosyltransferase involved in cell wall biosynthesis
LKVVHINTFDTGGAAIAMIALHKGLKDLGINSRILTRYKWSDEDDITKFHWEPPPFSTRLIRKLSGWKPCDVKNSMELKNYSFQHDAFTFPETDLDITDQKLINEADLIHLHWVADFIDYPTFFKKVNKPVIWTLHDKGPAMGGFHLLTDYERNLDNPVMKLENRLRVIKKKSLDSFNQLNIVAPSKQLLNFASSGELLGRFHFDRIYNGIKPDDFRTFNRSFSREILGLPHNKIIFLILGKSFHAFHKGFDLVEPVFKYFEIKDEIHFLIIGRKNIAADQFRNVTNIASINGIYELNIAYNACNATLIPSREENLPNTMLESMMCGVPVISFPVGGMLDVIDPALNGVISEESSSSSMIRAIELFIDRSNSFNSESIRQFAMDHFDLRKQSVKYLELYRKVIK